MGWNLVLSVEKKDEKEEEEDDQEQNRDSQAAIELPELEWSGEVKIAGRRRFVCLLCLLVCFYLPCFARLVCVLAYLLAWLLLDGKLDLPLWF